MPKITKPPKRVSFGPVTRFSSSFIEAQQAPDLHESSRLVDAVALHPVVSKPSTKTFTARRTMPPVPEADGLIGEREPEEYMAHSTRLPRSIVEPPQEALPPIQDAAQVATLEDRRRNDTQSLTAASNQGVTPAFSEAKRQASSDDDDTYDTPVEKKTVTRRHPACAAIGDDAAARKLSSFFLENPPTLSQLVSAVDDVIGGSQPTLWSPPVASPGAISTRGSRPATDGAAAISSPTNSSPSAPMSTPKGQKTDSYDMRESHGCAGVPSEAQRLSHQQEREGSRTANRSPRCSSQLSLVPSSPSTVTNASRNAVYASFCVFCGVGSGCGYAHQAPPLCLSDGIAYHTVCALWSPEVFYDVKLGALRGIAEAAHRARLIKCAWCRNPGAAVGCSCPMCQLSFHVPCAVKARASMNTREFSLYCPAHRPVVMNQTATDLFETASGETAPKRTKPEVVHQCSSSLVE
ncbi:hypothetical protein JKF63_01455 [Porcisia hertigi]|uniref:PHD-type domain-containing protein n=1 Tax=Porcisia hertigi TaxID=2761500 RepID=A0A836L3C3_9TRYP|nr:hypothetical protein JKF63_01455 [Porcisia hertigi]